MKTNFRFRDYALPLALTLAALMLLMRPSEETAQHHAHASCTVTESSLMPL